MALLTAEVTWLRWLLEDFGISVTTPTTLLSDSTGAISIARDPVKHELTKHIGVDAFFVRAAVQDYVVAGGLLHEGPDKSVTWILSLQTQCCGSTMSLRGGVRVII